MQEYILTVLTAFDALLVTLSQVALWQRKEYRLDRMKVHLFSPEGSLVKEWAVLASALCVVVAWGAFFMNAIALVVPLASASLLIIFGGHILRIARKGVFRPDFTSRAILVLAFTAILICVWSSFFIATGPLFALQLATFIFFLPGLVALSVYIVGIPAQIKKQQLISRAMEYRKHLKNLTVVGITGSVGKTSTKVYLVHLLGGESEYILATSEHRNSPYSVAQDMLARLSQKTLFYIAEMGAYAPGEIKELADLAQPKIGIITAITNQHAGLFGSLEALAHTKWELVRSLPQDGVAILNKDDTQIALQAKNLKKKVIWFSAKTNADISAADIIVQQTHTLCMISIGSETHSVTLPILSRGQLVPLLAAISAAHALGTDTTVIIKRLQTLPRLPRTMELLSGISHATVIDDSYSASEASVANAIGYLTNLSSKDIRLVMVPIIELGEEGSVVHERIGRLLATLSARVFIYGDAYKEDLVRGLGKNPKATVTWYSDAKKMSEEVTKGVIAKTVLLLEGRVPDIVRSSLL